MARKNHLPDSLELLLDTMCNTFGAIMFIAISIVVISQLSTKAIKEKEPVKITDEYLEKLRQKVRELEDDLAEEEQKMAEKALVSFGMPMEKMEKVEKLLALKNETRKLVLELDEQRKEMELKTKEKEKVESDVERVKSEIRRISDEIVQKKKLISQIKHACNLRKEELTREIAKTEADVMALEKEAKEKRTLRFSMEVSVDGAIDYTVCLKNGRFYCGEDEVRPIHDYDRKGHFSLMGNGHLISGNPDEAFSRLLIGVSQRNFVSIWCDQKSYPILVDLRQYLRKKKIKVRFLYTEDFRFSYVDSGINASD